MKIGLAVLVSALAVEAAGARLAPAHDRCRDARSYPTCGGYFVFEFNAASRIGGTKVDMPFGLKKNALDSWVAWDAGWMVNRSAVSSLGGALEIGGNSDGVHVALRGKAPLASEQARDR